MAEVTMTAVMHDGVTYPVDTPVSDIKGISTEQKDALRASGAIGEHKIPASVKSELDAAMAEVESLKKQLAEAKAAKAEAPKTETK